MNRKRKAALHEKHFGAYANIIRNMPCLVPGCKWQRSEAHHALARGAGGTKEHLVPLCTGHHLEVHVIGRLTFQEDHKVDLREIARELWEKFGEGGNGS